MANTENNTESNTYSEQTNKTAERKIQKEREKQFYCKQHPGSEHRSPDMVSFNLEL